MRILRFDREVASAIAPHGATGASQVRLGSSGGEAHLDVVHLDAGGQLGAHEAPVPQLFVVVAGEGWVSGPDGQRHPVREGLAALWDRGELHASGTDRGMVAVILQARELDIVAPDASADAPRSTTATREPGDGSTAGEATDLLAAFVEGARTGRAGALYLEGDVLHVDGWWQAALRLGDDAYLLRADPPPAPVDVIDRLEGMLRARGLEPVPGDHPLIEAVTYAELSLLGAAWDLWAPDAAGGQRALAGRVAPEVAGEGWAPTAGDHPALGDLSRDFAASLVRGLPPSVILAVGLDDDTVAVLRDAAPDSRLERSDPEGAVAVCGRIVPHVVIVDARDRDGRDFLLGFRAEACGRHVPIAAVTTGEPPRGADTVLDPRKPPSWWQERLRELLP